MSSKSLRILLVEDDEIDAEAFRRALRKSSGQYDVQHVPDGVAALERLLGDDGDAALKRPYVVVLDLNMPRMDGHELLEEIRGNPSLRDSVVFVLTTSHSYRDIMQAYEKNVAGYILKSNVDRDPAKLAAMLDHYSELVDLPPSS